VIVVKVRGGGGGGGGGKQAKEKIYICSGFSSLYGATETAHCLLVPLAPRDVSSQTNTAEIRMALEDLTAAEFLITSVVHPSTYLNKILIGSQQGTLHLWNLKTKYGRV